MILEQRDYNIHLVETLLEKIHWLLKHLPKEEGVFKKILRHDRSELQLQLREMKQARKRGDSFIFTHLIALYHVEIAVQACRGK
jgi:hypothetical protein